MCVCWCMYVYVVHVWLCMFLVVHVLYVCVYASMQIYVLYAPLIGDAHVHMVHVGISMHTCLCGACVCVHGASMHKCVFGGVCMCIRHIYAPLIGDTCGVHVCVCGASMYTYMCLVVHECKQMVFHA